MDRRAAKVLKSILKDLGVHWRFVIILLTPFLLCPLPIVLKTPAASCAYVVLIMVVFWLTEVLPLPVTALFPLALFPMLGVLSAGETAKQYLKDQNWVFFGSLLMALAVERSRLHQRIGLFTLIKIGSSPRRLMLGFMISTCFLSMWMSNTAATAMMVPLALTVIEELMETEEMAAASIKGEDVENAKVDGKNEIFALSPPNQSTHAIAEKRPKTSTEVTEAIKNHPSPQFRRTCKGLLLCICYSANIGGTGTLTGTSSNMVLTGQMESIYKSKETGLSFASWMAFSCPQMIVILLLAWLWLQAVYIGLRCTTRADDQSRVIKTVLSKKYKALEPMSFAEIATLFLFALLILLWLFRKPGFMPGWSVLFADGYVTDGTTAMLVSLLLFIVPSETPRLTVFSGRKKPTSTLASPSRPSSSLLTWNSVQKDFPWGIVILVGGGYAMAAGVQNSQLDKVISRALISLHAIPPYAFVTLSVLMVTFITEFSSNVAIASIFVPIGASVAQEMHLHPLYMLLPVTIACSFAFMLPVATPPNAVVFSAGLLRVMDMVLAGFVMNIICMLILLINIHTYGYWLFDCANYPEWAEKGNLTRSMNQTSN